MVIHISANRYLRLIALSPFALIFGPVFGRILVTLLTFARTDRSRLAAGCAGTNQGTLDHV